MVESSQIQPTQEQRIAQHWLASNFMPYVVVFASKTAQAKLINQNLSPAEFLRPFGEMGNLGGYAMLTNDKNEAVKLQNFRVNFIDIYQLNPDLKSQQRVLEQIIKLCKPNQKDEVKEQTRKQSKDELISQIKYSRSATEIQLTPWYRYWKKNFLANNRFQIYELTQQPVGQIFLISVDDDNPIGIIDQLRALQNEASQYKKKVYEIQKNDFVFIINDRSDNSRVEDSIMALKQKFQSKVVFVLKMSGQITPKEKLPDLWKNFIELDLREFADIRYGEQFLKEDRQIIQKHVRTVIELYLVPFIAQKIQHIEQKIQKTRKGLKNTLKSFFIKTTERGQNDGQKEGFTMDKTEIELRTLIDFSFIVQDFETVVQNAEYPINDFKKSSAFKYSTHCEEIYLFARMATDRNLLTRDFKEFVLMVNNTFDSYHLRAYSPVIPLTKFSICVASLFQELGRHKEASDIFIKMATILPDKQLAKSFLFEQAAYEFLYMRQFRKFAFYLNKAANCYGIHSEFKEFQMNCLTIIHPFYQSYIGWNQIQRQVFKTLANGASQDKAVFYFQNLLELSHQFQDKKRQQECIDICIKKVVQSSQQLGNFIVPKINSHTLEVFIDSESISTSNGYRTLNNQVFRSLFDLPPPPPNKKSEMNSNYTSWTMLQKRLSNFIKNHDLELSQVTIDDQFEFQIYDTDGKSERQLVVRKKIRKVFVGQPITVKFRMTNELKVSFSVTNLKLVAEGIQYEAISQNLYFDGDQITEISLQITPLNPGDIQITKIEWEAFEKFKCSYNIKDEQQFSYKVLEHSSELAIDLSLQRDMEAPLIFNESCTGQLTIQPSQPIKNMYIICSHPQLFGFQSKQIETRCQLTLRATKVGNVNVKFLIKYESNQKQRYKRIELNLQITEFFQIIPSFHLSKRVSNQYNTQIEIKMAQDNYEKPQIQKVQIIQPINKVWSLSSKEENFFILKKSLVIQEELCYKPIDKMIDEQISNEHLNQELNLIVVWSLDQDCKGYTVIQGINPSIHQQDHGEYLIRQQKLEPIVTFDFPRCVSINSWIQLELSIYNQSQNQVSIEVNLNENLEYFVWFGKTKYISVIEPFTISKICLNAKASDCGFFDLNAFSIVWRFSKFDDFGRIEIPDQLIVEVK